MDPKKTRENTFCCGGGGGMLMDELMDLRMKGAKPRAEAVRDVNAEYLAAPCAICKAQLRLAMDHYKLNTEVGGALDLVGKAIKITKMDASNDISSKESKKKTKCSLCEKEFQSYDECANHTEKSHEISKNQADMCCEPQ